MANLISKEQVSYMQAWIKKYDDGTEVLQSFQTDVVKKNKDGSFTRLWKGHGVRTGRQVQRAYGLYFRGIQFEDGTYEDLRPVYKRYGYKFHYDLKTSRSVGMSKDIIKYKYKYFLENNKTIRDIANNYSTCIDKELRKHYKKNKKMLDLLMAMRVCLEGKVRQNKISMLCKLNNFDFRSVYDCIKHKYKLGELRQ